MIRRGGRVVIRMLADVKQKTIGPLIRTTIAPGTAVFTDEYDIYARLPQWGYAHHTVCHATGEFARDDDGDGFCEVHVDTLEGFSGCCSAHGCAPIEGFRRSGCRCTWGSSSSCIMSGGGARRCWDR